VSRVLVPTISPQREPADAMLVHDDRSGPEKPETGKSNCLTATLYGLVRTGKKAEAIRFLQKTRSRTRKEAAKKVAVIAGGLGMK